jgi:hypothetical protein
MWRDAKKKRPGIVNHSTAQITAQKDFKASQPEKTRPKFGTQHSTMKLKNEPLLLEMQKSQPLKNDALKQISKQKTVLPIQNRGKEQFGTNVLKSEMMSGNIPKTLAFASKKRSKGVERLSRNFTASNYQNVKGRPQPVHEGVCKGQPKTQQSLK